MLDDLAREYRLDLTHAGIIDPDDVPDVPEQPYVNAGELWALGDHRVLCGDATDPSEVARLLAGAEPRLLATDPPYGVSLDNAARGAGTGSRKRSRGHRNTSFSGDTRVDWAPAFALVPSLNVGYVWHAGSHAAEVAQGLARVGFEVVAQIIWDKGRFALGRGWYHWAHEPCWVVRRPGAVFIGGRAQSTVWHARSPKMPGGDEAAWDHPTQKPVLLFETAIGNHLRPGEALYDPFCGSGTGIVAAERLGRRCYAMDIDPRFVQVTIERWQLFTGRQAVRVDG